MAASIQPTDRVAVAHLAGSLGLDAVDPHPRPAALHPLVALPDAEVGARRLLSGCWFAVAGDPLVAQVVDDLGGRALAVADADRAAYHAAAVVASNHLVALLGQAERIASTAGVPFDALMDLVRATVDNVDDLGPGRRLDRPRGPRATKPPSGATSTPSTPDEQAAYEALAQTGAPPRRPHRPAVTGTPGPVHGSRPGSAGCGPCSTRPGP